MAVVLVAVFAPVMLSQLMPRVASDLRAPIVVYTTAIVCMVLAARDACEASLEGLQGGLKGVKAMDVWVASFV